MDNKEAVENRKQALEEELDTYKKYREEFEDIIRQMLDNGGIRLQWLMK